jgi:hypothetical protein
MTELQNKLRDIEKSSNELTKVVKELLKSTKEAINLDLGSPDKEDFFYVLGQAVYQRLQVVRFRPELIDWQTEMPKILEEVLGKEPIP